MEIFLTLLVVLTSCLAAVIIRFVLNRRKSHKLLKNLGIPGPETDFLTGNMDEMLSAPTPNDVITKWLKEYGNIFGFYIGSRPHIIIKDLDILKQIFIRDFAFFCNRPHGLDVYPINKTLIGLRDKRWKEVRTFLTPTFSSSKIKFMTRIVDKKVDVAVSIVTKKAENNEMFDMYELVQGLTIDVIADCAFAMKTNCQENPQDVLLTSVRDAFRVARNKALLYAVMFPFVRDLMAVLYKYSTAGRLNTLIMGSVSKAIVERRKNREAKSLDLLQLMLEHSEGEDKTVAGMSDEEILANAYLFLLAGYETTATALAFTFYLLIKHPDVQEQLYREIAGVEDVDYNTIQNLQYLDQVFSESLRLYPPVTGFITRECNEDHQVGSLTIPKRTVIQVPIWDIQHDPELWPDPWKFDPDRFSPENKASQNNMAYLPFGIGRRNCIGARFAQLEAKLTLYRLVKKFKFEKCEKTDDPLTLACPTFIINPAHGVYLRAKPRTAKV